MKSLFLSFFTLFNFIHAQDLHFLLFTEQNENRYTISNNQFKSVDITTKYPSLTTLIDFEKYQLYASYKHIPYQFLGSTTIKRAPLELFQEAYQYEAGIGRKFYLSDDLIIAPALVYFYTRQHNVQKLPIKEIHTHKSDVDLRAYLYLVYRLFDATYIYANYQLDNDLLSNEKPKEYNQYPYAVAIYQFFTPHLFFNLKYQANTKDRPIINAQISNQDYRRISIGLGYAF